MFIVGLTAKANENFLRLTLSNLITVFSVYVYSGVNSKSRRNFGPDNGTTVVVKFGKNISACALYNRMK